MINSRLFEHYRIDTSKDLGIQKRCARPFDTVLIDKQGSCYACECQSWLPQSIGNLQLKPLRDIIGSTTHQHLRDSITDGTYRYCNEHQCAHIRSGLISETTETRVRKLRLAIDDSCNLRCPSCRKDLVFHKEGRRFDLGIRLADRVNDWLREQEQSIKVHMGSDGDPFASHVYRHFMEHTPRRSHIKYSILTNGIMFENFYQTVPHVIDNLHELGVSIDGATKETYEKLRVGGHWDKILSNLDCMRTLRQSKQFTWTWHMVVQHDNWREMADLLALAHEHGVDRVYFNLIQDWNTGLPFKGLGFCEEKDYKDMLVRLQQDPVARIYSLL